MPIEVTDGCSKNQCIKEYRIWSVATQKCLVLKKSNASLNVTCAGIGVEDGTGKQGSSKSQLFIFVVFICSLVKYLTIKFQNQLHNTINPS